MTAFDDLMAFQRQTEALAQVAGRLGWDQETMMPHGAAEQRSEEMAAMEGVLHARRTDRRIADWLAAVEPSDPVARAQVRLIRRSHERRSRSRRGWRKRSRASPRWRRASGPGRGRPTMWRPSCRC